MKTNNKISQIVVLLGFLIGTFGMEAQIDTAEVLIDTYWYATKLEIEESGEEVPYIPEEDDKQFILAFLNQYVPNKVDYQFETGILNHDDGIETGSPYIGVGAIDLIDQSHFDFTGSFDFLNFPGVLLPSNVAAFTTPHAEIDFWSYYISTFFEDYLGDTFIYTINEIEDDLQLIIENPAGDKVYYQNVPNLDAPSFQQAAIAVYPNPVQNTLYLEGLRAEATLQLYDVSGKKLLDQPVQEEAQIEVSNLSAGIYFYQISQSGKAIKTGKVVKE